MKKYVLLIAVMVVVFLGLGNYGFAQNQGCDATRNAHSSEIWGSHYFSCESSDSSKNPACNTSGNEQRCYPPITGDTCTTYCCICVEDLTHMEQTSFTPIEVDDITPPTLDERCEENEHNNVFGMCVCNTGFGEYYDVVEGKTKCGDCSRDDVCCGVKLNTRVPFIGDCIEDEKYTNDPTSVSQEEAFPVLMSSLTQMLVTIILIVSFVLIIIGGIQIATGNPSGGKKMIIKVVVAIAILGASGVILRLINPNFFG